MIKKELLNQEEAQTGTREGKVVAKRPYHKPSLARFGRTIDLTNGPSLGLQESGNPGIFKA